MNSTSPFGFEVNDSWYRKTGAIAKCHLQKGQSTHRNVLPCPVPGGVPQKVVVAAFYDFML